MSKTKVLFAHSAGPQYGLGKGSYDLVRYLRTKLKADYRVLFPMIEKPTAPTYSKFKALFRSAFDALEEPIVLMGHSLGGSLLLKYLSEEKPRIPVLGLFLVSTPHWKSTMPEFQLEPHFEKALKGISKIFLYHSKNDDVVPISNLAFYEKAFPHAVVRTLKGKEHTFERGLPSLISDIRSL